MSVTVKFNDRDLENLDNLENDTTEYVEVPYGMYEVAVAGITYKERKAGNPMATIRFKVLNGEYKGNSIFYNQIVDERSGKGGQSYGYGDYGGQTGQNYSEEDQHLMAAMNYIRARRYNEAINVLNSMSERSARWYYFSSYANLGLGNNVVAMDYAKKAVDMDPGNQEYQQYYQKMYGSRG